MDTAKLDVSVASLPAQQGEDARRAPRVDEPPPVPTEQRSTFFDQEWTYRAGFEQLLSRVPSAAWEDPRSQGWQLVKRNASREVWRAALAGRTYYIKYYCGEGLTARLRSWLRRSPCESEWQGGLFALRAGIPAVSPAACARQLRRAGRACDILVTEAVEPAYPLNEFWQQVVGDDSAARRRRDTHHLAELLAELIARAHQSGFEHLDMHAANILVQPVAAGRYRALFVDLHSARLGVPISDRAVVRNLAQLNQWFRRYGSLADRLRFLRAYLRWRDEYEHAFPHGRALGLTFAGLVQALAHAARGHAERLGAQRDRRTQRDGRYFSRLRLADGWRAVVLLRTKHASAESRASRAVLERAWWRAQLANPLRWFQDDQATDCKDSHSAIVRRALLPHPDGNLPVIIKRPRARDWRRRLSQSLGRSRSLRGWRMGHALLHRHVPAARPLAALERRIGPWVLDSVLITEAIPGGIDLESYLRQAGDTTTGPAWWRLKRELSAKVAAHLRGLEERGFAHRDCKASNILVVPHTGHRLLWIDMDGLRRAPRGPGWHARARALVALHVSLQTLPGLTRTDWLRFLMAYSARFGADPNAWRGLWRQLSPPIEDKLRAKAARRDWKLKRYGRE